MQYPPVPSYRARGRWPTVIAAFAAIGLGAPVSAQVVIFASPFAATWTGQANSNWSSNAPWSPGGPPTDTATFPDVANKLVVFPAATSTIGQMIFTAPGYTVNITSGNSTLTFAGNGILTGADPATNPANRPVINIAGAGDTVAFINNATGGLARFEIGAGGVLDASTHALPSNMTAGAITNAGLITLGHPDGVTVGNTLTVHGPYVGNGGTIRLNTYLGSDGAPSDRLVIDGSRRTIDGPATATGLTYLSIVNAGGPGAMTINNGIPVVSAINGGTTAPGAFALAGSVRVGAFDYRLFRGSVDGVSAPDDWFLRSFFLVVPPTTGPITVPPGSVVVPPTTGPITVPPGFIVVPPTTGPITVPPGSLVVPPTTGPITVPPGFVVVPPTTGPITAPPGVIFPTEPPVSPADPPPGIYPIVGPELATYGVVQPIARQLGLATLGTFHERIGDASAAVACLNAHVDATSVSDQECRRGAWGRVFGQEIDNHYQAFVDPRATGHIVGIQTGTDLWRGSLVPNHSDTAGVYVSYGNSNVDVSGLVTNAASTGYMLQRTGAVNLNAYSLGAYWTHYGPTDWYIDAVLQGSHYDGDATTQLARLSTHGSGVIASLETGYPIPMAGFGPGFVLEPEAQIIWQRASFNDGTDGLDVGTIALGTTTGTTGRLGLRGRWTISDPSGKVWQPYVLANLWHDWGANTTTSLGADTVPLVEMPTRLELGAGFSAKLLHGFSLYAQAGYQKAVGSSGPGKRDGAKGDLGLRYAW